jgi:RimJ/RimL family protein N-acetyltransferase
MPFAVAWSDAIGTPGFLDDFVAFHRQARNEWRAEQWQLLFGVWTGDELIGTQGVSGDDFADAREVVTGSWLGRRFQRQGYGTEMRAAVLELAFAGLGARTAVSGAMEGNVASERVSAKLGYVVAGEGVRAPRGVPVREQTFRLDRERWETLDRLPVEIAGLEPCLPLFGLAS